MFFGNALSVLACALLIYLKVPETRPDARSEVTPQRGHESRCGMGPVLRDGRFMAAVGLSFLLAMAVVAALSPAHARARYQGMHTFAWSAATFAGPLLGGLAIDHFGDDSLWIACAVLGTVVALGYRLLRNVFAPLSEPGRIAPTDTAAPGDAKAERLATTPPAERDNGWRV